MAISLRCIDYQGIVVERIHIIVEKIVPVNDPIKLPGCVYSGSVRLSPLSPTGVTEKADEALVVLELRLRVLLRTEFCSVIYGIRLSQELPKNSVKKCSV